MVMVVLLLLLVVLLLLVLVVCGCGLLVMMVGSGCGSGRCCHRLRASVALRATGRARGRRLLLFAGSQVSGKLTSRAIRVAAR